LLAKYPNHMGVNTYTRPPKWWRSHNLLEVAPPYELFVKFQNGAVDPKEYNAVYKAHIGGIHAYKLVEEIAKNNNNATDLVFMIYGIPSRDYHVDILMEYLKNYGFEIKNIIEF